MKVKDLNCKDVNIFNVRVEVRRCNGTVCYFVLGDYVKGFLTTDTILQVFLDQEQALDYAEDLKSKLASEVLEDSGLTCGV